MKIIQAKLTKINQDSMILSTNDNEKITWPANKLSPNIRIGQMINFQILSDDELKQTQKQLAKEILEKIFNPNAGEK